MTVDYDVLKENIPPVALQVLITFGYSYEIAVIYPAAFEKSSLVLLLLIQVLTAWSVIASIFNLHLIKRRTSLVESRNLAVPFDLTQEKIEMAAQKAKEEKNKVENENGTGTVSPEENYNDPDKWHICHNCNVFVPPRAWHCKQCRKCILRRDHHCSLATYCIGEENHSNFLGLILYLGIGASLCSACNIYYFIWLKKYGLGYFLIRSYVVIYTFLYDFDIDQLLSSIAMIGQIVAWGAFIHFMKISLKGQTSADVHRKIDRVTPGTKQRGYENLKNFLGPRPIFQMLWPFHKPFQIVYYNASESKPRDDYLKSL